MKCKTCGQEIKRRTNFDRLKDWLNRSPDEFFDEVTGDLCGGSRCPLGKYCPDDVCLFMVIKKWCKEEVE